MNFVQPGGVALAAVELPETGLHQHRLLVRILQRERPQESHCRSMHRVCSAATEADGEVRDRQLPSNDAGKEVAKLDSAPKS